MAAAAVAAVAFTSCCRSARIEGTLADAPESQVIVKLLDVNKYKVLDTVKTDIHGKFSYKTSIEAGQPEFIYLFHNNTRIASMLLQRGDKVQVTADTLGTYSVTGSDETLKLMEVEKDEADFENKFMAASARMNDLDPSSAEAIQLKKDISAQYIAYYRSRVKYILQNSHSLTSIPVLYQNIGESLPVFGQITDAIHFRNICDSLQTVYPESKYVKALDKEATRRHQMLSLNARIQSADESAFPDIELADINGKKVKLSSMDSKVVMIYFWSSSDAAQKMFNQDVMKPVYNEFHSKGFDIYSVAADADKAAWASVVKSQKLPWTNVCDPAGSTLGLYTGCTVVVVEEIVGLSDTAVCRIPDGIDVGDIGSEISSADVSPCCRYRPWSAVCCDFGLVEPFFSGETVRERVGYAAEVLFRLPEVCVRQPVVWHPVKE